MGFDSGEFYTKTQVDEMLMRHRQSFEPTMANAQKIAIAEELVQKAFTQNADGTYTINDNVIPDTVMTDAEAEKALNTLSSDFRNYVDTQYQQLDSIMEQELTAQTEQFNDFMTDFSIAQENGNSKSFLIEHLKDKLKNTTDPTVREKISADIKGLEQKVGEEADLKEFELAKQEIQQYAQLGYAISNLAAATGNTKAASQIAQVVNIAANVALAYAAFSSGQLLTGATSAINAVAGIAGLFGGGGKDASAERHKQLMEAIQNLHKDMLNNFERVNHKLDALIKQQSEIGEKLLEGQAEIKALLGDTIQQLKGINQGINVNFEKVLSELDTIKTLIKSGNLSDDLKPFTELKKELNKDQQLEREYYEKAHRVLVDDLLNKAVGLESNRNVTHNLSNLRGVYGLSPDTHGTVRLDYLINEVLQGVKGSERPTNRPIANPSLWASMANTLMQMRLTHPEYNLKHELIDPEDLKTIISDGKNILRASYDLQQNSEHFKSLIEDHKSITETAKTQAEILDINAKKEAYSGYAGQIIPAQKGGSAPRYGELQELFEKTIITVDPLNLYSDPDTRGSKIEKEIKKLNNLLTDAEKHKYLETFQANLTNNTQNTTNRVTPTIGDDLKAIYEKSNRMAPVIDSVDPNIFIPHLPAQVREALSLGIGKLEASHDIKTEEFTATKWKWPKTKVDRDGNILRPEREEPAFEVPPRKPEPKRIIIGDFEHISSIDVSLSINIGGQSYDLGQTTYNVGINSYAHNNFDQKELLDLFAKFTDGISNGNVQRGHVFETANPNDGQKIVTIDSLSHGYRITEDLNKVLTQDIPQTKNSLRNAYRLEREKLLKNDEKLETLLQQLNESAAKIQAHANFAFNPSLRSDFDFQDMLFGSDGLLDRDRFIMQYTANYFTKRAISEEKDSLSNTIEAVSASDVEQDWLRNLSTSEQRWQSFDASLDKLNSFFEEKTAAAKNIYDKAAENVDRAARERKLILSTEERDNLIFQQLRVSLESNAQVNNAVSLLIAFEDKAFFEEQWIELGTNLQNEGSRRTDIVELMYALLHRTPNSETKNESFSGAITAGPLDYAYTPTAPITEIIEGEFVFTHLPGQQHQPAVAKSDEPLSFDDFGSTEFQFRIGENHRGTWIAGLNTHLNNDKSSAFHQIKIQDGKLVIEARGGVEERFLAILKTTPEERMKAFLETGHMSYEERQAWKRKKQDEERQQIRTSRSIDLKEHATYKVRVETGDGKSEIVVAEQNPYGPGEVIRLSMEGIEHADAQFSVVTRGLLNADQPSESQVFMDNLEHHVQSRIGVFGRETNETKSISLDFANESPLIQSNGRLIFRHTQTENGKAENNKVESNNEAASNQTILGEKQRFSDHYKTQFQVTTDDKVENSYFAAGLRNYQTTLDDKKPEQYHEVIFDGKDIFIASNSEGTEPGRIKIGEAQKNTTYQVDIETSANTSTIYVYPAGGERPTGYTLDVDDNAWGDTRFEAHGKRSPLGNDAAIAMDNYLSYRNRPWTEYINYNETGKQLGMNETEFNQAIEVLKNDRFWDADKNSIDFSALISWMKMEFDLESDPIFKDQDTGVAPSTTPATTPTPSNNLTPNAQQYLRISKALVNPVGPDAGNESIVLHNDWYRPTMLTDLYLEDEQGNRYNLPEVSIPPGDDYVLSLPRESVILDNYAGTLSLKDKNGNTIQSVGWNETQVVEAGEGSLLTVNGITNPNQQAIKITDVLVNPAGPDKNREKIVLSNTGSVPTILDGLYIKDSEGRRQLLPSIALAPGETYTLDLKYFMMGNTKGALFLMNGNDEQLQAVAYSATPADEGSYVPVSDASTPFGFVQDLL